MKEKLELVTDFATLRTGMIVVTKACKLCNTDCRCMLGRYLSPSETDTGLPGWNAMPPCIDRPCHVGPSTVDARKVYRVVDGLEQTTETRKAVTA